MRTEFKKIIEEELKGQAFKTLLKGEGDHPSPRRVLETLRLTISKHHTGII